MKKAVVLLCLSFMLPLAVGAETVILTRRTSFPKFGTAKTVVSVERRNSYMHSRTLAENRHLVPVYYQVGFRQVGVYHPNPWDKYRMTMWR
jgi:hypothetical protein